MSDALGIGRLKARVEGDWWVFRYELEPGVEREFGRVAMDRVTANEARKAEAMKLFAAMVSDLVEEATGSRVEFDQSHAAPEHERAGRA